MDGVARTIAVYSLSDSYLIVYMSQDHTPRWAARANTACRASTATHRWMCFVFLEWRSSSRHQEAPPAPSPPTICRSPTRSSARSRCGMQSQQLAPAPANRQRKCATRSPRSWLTFATSVIKSYICMSIEGQFLTATDSLQSKIRLKQLN